MQAIQAKWARFESALQTYAADMRQPMDSPQVVVMKEVIKSMFAAWIGDVTKHKKSEAGEEFEKVLAAAIEAKETCKVRLYLNFIIDINRCTDKRKNHLLFTAAVHSNESIVHMLLEHPGIDLNPRDHQDYTPLLVAACLKREDITLMILRAGANPALINRDHINFLSILAQMELVDMLRTILDEDLIRSSVLLQQLYYMDNDGNAPIHIAAAAKSVHVLRQMVRIDSNLNAESPSDSKSRITPLHIAAQKGRAKNLRLLLDYGRIDVRDALGFTPLLMAALYNQLECVNLLIERGANVRARTRNKTTAMVCAKDFAIRQVLARAKAI